MDIARMILEDRRNAETFVLHDGPPYASGETHIGIGFNKILKDIIVKYWSMRGMRVPSVPGWDCHGLPIESKVQSEVKGQFPEPSPLEIRQRCAAHAARYVQEQKEQFQRLGVFADWDRPYLTMSPAYEAGVLAVLSEITAKGYVYHGLRPVDWCHVCETVLADAEIEKREVHRQAALVQFPLEPLLSELLRVERGSSALLVATRDIWTLPGCVAVAVHPEREYVAFSYTSERGVPQTIIVEEGAADDVRLRLSLQADAGAVRVKGREMESLLVRHPFTQQSMPVVLDEGARDRSLTGVAPVVPAHYREDFHLASCYSLPVPLLIDKQGRFTMEAGGLEGRNIRDAEETILNWMREMETVSHVEMVRRQEPHGSRCGHALLVIATEQWFVSLEHREYEGDSPLREKVLREVDRIIRWMPEDDKERIHDKIAQRPDWCISRQRHWGVPIPSLLCRSCGAKLLAPEVIKVVRDLVAVEGSQVWYEVELSEVLADPRLADFRCQHCGGSDLAKDPDFSILDIWFESGTSWRSALIGDHRLSFPADLCVEGYDQHGGWFQRSLITSIMVTGKAPFKTALTHGFVLDEKRRRMTKHLRNFVSLKQVLDQVPVDLLRLYFIRNKSVRQDLPLSIPALMLLEPEYRTFRNCFRYLLGNLSDYSPIENVVPLMSLSRLDLWIIARLHELIDKVTGCYAEYRFKDAVEHLYTFCNETLSKTYFEAVKDRLYNESPNSASRRSAQTAMHSILMALIKMLAPILVYTCEEVWDLCPGVYDCASVHLSLWPDTKGSVAEMTEAAGDNALQEFDEMFRLRDALQPRLEQARQASIIGGNSEVRIILHVAETAAAISGPPSHWRDSLRDSLTVSEVTLADSPEGLQELPELAGVYCGVERVSYQQCLRCRRYDASVGDNPSQPTFCRRCVDVLTQINAYTIPRTAAAVGPQTRPSDLAAFMRAADIRKVAILNEGGRCTAYYLHLASQQVMPHPDLQALAEYVQGHEDFRNHSALLLGLGEHTDTLFGIGIHQLARGTPLGGTREFTYDNVGQLLENLLRLSYGMSIKNAIAMLPHGGGKSIIDTCGLDFKVHRELRRRVYRDFGQFTATLFGRYICAEDANNTTADTLEMLSSCRHVMCLPEGVGGSGNPSRFTALVGWLAAKAGWKFWSERGRVAEAGSALDGVTVAIQGVGNVGYNLIDILTEGEPRLKKILVADKSAGQIENVVKLLHRKGKADLLEIRGWRDPLLKGDRVDPGAAGALKERRDQPEDDKTYILYSECDILVPAAMGKVVYPENVEHLRCKVIVPIANNAYTDNDAVGRGIWERGIVDVVEGNVNWGGATVAATEIYGYDEDHVIEWCLEKVYRDTIGLLCEATKRGVPPWEVKKQEAEERMKEPHPIVRAARSYKFIGDVSENFATWITSKWLRNITGLGTDKYAEHVARKASDYLSRHG
jgi:isoleucyl-tRNA synthetase